MARVLKKYEATAAPQIKAITVTSNTRRCVLERDVVDEQYRVLKITTHRFLGSDVAFTHQDHREIPMDTTNDVLDGVGIMQEMTGWSHEFCRTSVATVMMGW